MLFEAIKNRAEEHGCDSCKRRDLEEFYTVDLYFLPTKLVRKRHKDRGQMAIYCRACFEGAGAIPYKFNGESRYAERGNPVPACSQCDSEIVPGKLYGKIAFTLFRVSGTGESGPYDILNPSPLTQFCSECAESGTISLTRQLGD